MSREKQKSSFSEEKKHNFLSLGGEEITTNFVDWQAQQTLSQKTLWALNT